MASVRSNICDKCGKPVPRWNDASVIQKYVTGRDLGNLVVVAPRHFLPTTDCEGSPSRAQYIEGQPRDPRGGYDQSLEMPYRLAFAKVLIESSRDSGLNTVDERNRRRDLSLRIVAAGIAIMILSVVLLFVCVAAGFKSLILIAPIIVGFIIQMIGFYIGRPSKTMPV